MHLTLARTLTTAVAPSMRVLETASMFGIGVDEQQRLDLIQPTQINLPIPGPGVVFITGPSGGGKSTILTLIKEACETQQINVICFDALPELPERPLVDVFDLPLKQVTALLAAAGLGDAFTMLRTPAQLSDGQRYRLQLAHAMHLAANAPSVILTDEFGALLDRLTASIIARNMRRWADRSGCTFIAATTHDDLIDALQPDVLIYKGLGSELQVVRSRDCSAASSTPAADRLRLEPATLADYRALAAFHYKSAQPTAMTSAFRLVHNAPTIVGRYLSQPHERTTVGVLVRTLPHLACTLRDEATGNRYRHLGNKAAAMMLNREVRTIARVVIHPQWRGLGLAVDLVRHALANPEPNTVYTEALAAMGHVHPFFERAGMVRYHRPPRASHARLLDAMAHLGVDPALLASPRMVREQLAHDEPRWRLFTTELRRWHRTGARRSRHHRDESTLDAMLNAARDQLLTLPVYYLHRH